MCLASFSRSLPQLSFSRRYSFAAPIAKARVTLVSLRSSYTLSTFASRISWRKRGEKGTLLAHLLRGV